MHQPGVEPAIDHESDALTSNHYSTETPRAYVNSELPLKISNETKQRRMHSATLSIYRNLQQHRGVSLRQHGFIVCFGHVRTGRRSLSYCRAYQFHGVKTTTDFGKAHQL